MKSKEMYPPAARQLKAKRASPRPKSYAVTMCASHFCVMEKVIDVFMCMEQGCSIAFVDRLAPEFLHLATAAFLVVIQFM